MQILFMNLDFIRQDFLRVIQLQSGDHDICINSCYVNAQLDQYTEAEVHAVTAQTARS
jgi:hypothetical protein